MNSTESAREAVYMNEYIYYNYLYKCSCHIFHLIPYWCYPHKRLLPTLIKNEFPLYQIQTGAFVFPYIFTPPTLHGW